MWSRSVFPSQSFRGGLGAPPISIRQEPPMPRLPTAAVILFFLSFGCNRPAPAPAPAATPAPETPNVPNASNSALPPGERVENPRYRQWSAHKPGTTVVVREKTDTPAYK